MEAFWIAVIILAFVALLFYIHIRIRLCFSLGGDDNSITVSYLFLKFKIRPREAEKEAKTLAEDEADDNKKSMPDSKKLLRLIKAAYKDIKDGISSLLGYIIKHAITIYELNISAEYGFENPMHTGIVTGTANAVVYNIIGMLERNMKLKSSSVSLTPDFENQKLKAGVYCELGTNIWHILALGAIIIKTAVKIIIVKWRIKE